MDKGMNRGAVWGLLALVLAIGIMGSALAAGPALAAKGGNGVRGGGKGHNGGTSTATCSVTPNPLPILTWGTFNGSGFAPTSNIGFTVSGPTGTVMGFLTADATGSFSAPFYAGSVAGTYTVWVSDYSSATATCTLGVA